MKVKTVSYRRTVNLGNYSSATFEASAELDTDESPEEAAQNITHFVVEFLQTEHDVELYQASGSVV